MYSLVTGMTEKYLLKHGTCLYNYLSTTSPLRSRLTSVSNV